MDVLEESGRARLNARVFVPHQLGPPVAIYSVGSNVTLLDRAEQRIRSRAIAFVRCRNQRGESRIQVGVAGFHFSGVAKSLSLPRARQDAFSYSCTKPARRPLSHFTAILKLSDGDS